MLTNLNLGFKGFFALVDAPFMQIFLAEHISLGIVVLLKYRLNILRLL